MKFDAPLEAWAQTLHVINAQIRDLRLHTDPPDHPTAHARGRHRAQARNRTSTSSGGRHRKSRH